MKPLKPSTVTRRRKALFDRLNSMMDEQRIAIAGIKVVLGELEQRCTHVGTRVEIEPPRGSNDKAFRCQACGKIWE